MFSQDASGEVDELPVEIFTTESNRFGAAMILLAENGQGASHAEGRSGNWPQYPAHRRRSKSGFWNNFRRLPGRVTRFDPPILADDWKMKNVVIKSFGQH